MVEFGPKVMFANWETLPSTLSISGGVQRRPLHAFVTPFIHTATTWMPVVRSA